MRANVCVVLALAACAKPVVSSGEPSRIAPVAKNLTITLSEDEAPVIAKAALTDAGLTIHAPSEWIDSGDAYLVALDAQHLNDAQTATRVFTYSLTDGALTSNEAQVTITITGVNDVAVARADTANGNANETIVVAWRENDTDVDDAMIVLDSVSAPVAGVIVDNGDGTFTYDPQHAFDALTALQAIDVVVTYTCKDGSGSTATIHVQGVNDAPVATAVMASTPQDTAVVVAVTGTDVDDDIVTLYDVQTDGTRGTVALSGAVLVFTPDASFRSLSSEGATDATVFQYRVIDSHGAISAPAIVTVVVSGSNDPPSAVLDVIVAEEGGDATVTDLLTNDFDIDADAITFVGFDAAALQGVLATSGSIVTYTPTGAHFEALSQGALYSESLGYEIEDSHGARAVGVVRFDTTGTNDVPHANDDAITINAFASATIDVLANDTDVDAHDDKVITNMFAPSPEGASGAYTPSRIYFDPNGVTGVFTITYAMRDQHAATPEQSATLTVTVTPGEPCTFASAPVFAATVAEGGGVPIDWKAPSCSNCTLYGNGVVLAQGLDVSYVHYPIYTTGYEVSCANNQPSSVAASGTVHMVPAYFVDAAAASGGDGGSWANAYSSLAEAAARAGAGAVSIWIKEGTYVLGDTVELSENNRVLGGFASTLYGQQSGDLSARSATGTVLTGSALRLADGVTLDRFAVQNGQGLSADGASHVTLRDLTFTHNSRPQGSALNAVNGNDWLIEGCLFHENTAAGVNWSTATDATGAEGGAIYLRTMSGVVIRDVQLTDNVAQGGHGGLQHTGGVFPISGRGADAAGGALFVRSSEVTLDNVMFSGNRTRGGHGGPGGNGYSAGAFWPESPEGKDGQIGGFAKGGACSIDTASSVAMVDVVFNDNQATGGNGGAGGGGINGAPNGFGANGADGVGGGIAVDASSITFTSSSVSASVAAGGTGVVNGSAAGGGLLCAGGCTVNGAPMYSANVPNDQQSL